MAYALIIDNDQMLRSVLADQLKRVGIASKEAANGLEGLERVKEERPAVIVLDEHMPQMDGQQFIEALQKEGLSIGIRIIVFTSLDDVDLMNHKLIAGVSDYLNKGTSSPEVIVKLVQKYMDALPPQPTPESV